MAGDIIAVAIDVRMQVFAEFWYSEEKGACDISNQ